MYWCDNPLHSSISMHILPTGLYTFPWVLTRRICLSIKRMTLMCDAGVILLGEVI